MQAKLAIITKQIQTNIINLRRFKDKLFINMLATTIFIMRLSWCLLLTFYFNTAMKICFNKASKSSGAIKIKKVKCLSTSIF